jgi:formate dehydrogenase major subunit
MTNGWIDIKNTDMMLIMGGNPAENHPCGFKWAMEAKRNRNAKLISVDPRFTRTSSTADLFCQIRAGTDIAFLGGLIRYAIENNRIAKDYLVNYTNAAFIVKEGFKLPEDGLYSGFDAASSTYDKTTWNYQEGGDLSGKAGAATSAPAAAASGSSAAGASGHAPEPVPGKPGGPAPPPALPPNTAYDLTLQHPRCVFQLMRQQYSRYTPEAVERITGIPRDQFLKAVDLFTSVRKDGDMKKVGTIIYAVGWTQHTFGTQIIRTAAMIQLLLGNVGRAGGGVNALRGHSNIQGATDMAGLYDSLPGYLKGPVPTDTNLAAFLKRTTPTASKPGAWDSFNYYSNTPKFMVSLLKSFYGDAATKENDFGFDYLPKPGQDCSWTHIWDDMYNGKIKGMFAFGMNGVMIGPDTNKNINALKKADWLVVGEIYQDETSVRRLRRKRRQYDQLGALGHLEICCSSASGRCPPRPGHRRADFLARSPALPERRRKVPRRPSQYQLGLCGCVASPTFASGHGRQRQSSRRPHRPGDGAGDQSGPTAAGFCVAERRRYDLLRQLDLFRQLDGSGGADSEAKYG